MSTETQAVDNLRDYLLKETELTEALHSVYMGDDGIYSAEVLSTLHKFRGTLLELGIGRDSEAVYRIAVQHLNAELLDLGRKSNIDLMKIEEDDPETAAIFASLQDLNGPEDTERRGSEIRRARTHVLNEISDILAPAPFSSVAVERDRRLSSN